MRILFLATIILVSGSVVSQALAESKEKCAIPGSLMHWEFDHCFLRSGTDDEEHPLVRSCVNLAPRYGSLTPKEECKRKTALKEFRCFTLRNNPDFRMTQEECMKSTDTNGLVVRNGGIGG